MTIFQNSGRTFVAENEVSKHPPGLSLYGFSADRRQGPWEISRATYDGQLLPGVRDLLVGLDQYEAIQPYIIDRSVFMMDDRPWQEPSGVRYYYIVCLMAEREDWGIKRLEQTIRLHPPAPARSGELHLATPNELTALCRDWSPDHGLVYRLLFPIIAAGGPRYAIHNQSGQKKRRMFLKLETCELYDADRTILKAQHDHLPSRVGILVRSRRPL